MHPITSLVIKYRKQGSGYSKQIKLNVSKHGAIKKPILLMTLAAVAISLTTFGHAEGDDVEAFKEYLATPPCIARLVYTSMTHCSPATQHKELIVFCGGSFYLRAITDADKLDLPISKSNRMHSSLFAGKSGAESWQINGFGLSKSVNPDASRPDPYYAFASAMQDIAYGVINAGAQQIIPGTFKWRGTDFEATPNPALKPSNAENIIRGKIVVNQGRIVEMDLLRPVVGSPKGVMTNLTFIYEYAISSKRPNWFPANITVKARDECHFKYAIEELSFGNQYDLAEAFIPENHLAPEVTLLTVVSNSQTIIKPDGKSPAVIAMTLEAMPPRSERALNRQTLVRVVICVLLFVPACFFLARVFTKRRNGT